MIQITIDFEVGTIFRNLRELIEHCGLKGHVGDTKIKNLELLKEYISWEKIEHSHKIRITEIKKR